MGSGEGVESASQARQEVLPPPPDLLIPPPSAPHRPQASPPPSQGLPLRGRARLTEQQGQEDEEQPPEQQQPPPERHDGAASEPWGWPGRSLRIPHLAGSQGWAGGEGKRAGGSEAGRDAAGAALGCPGNGRWETGDAGAPLPRRPHPQPRGLLERQGGGWLSAVRGSEQARS